jgi:hypothetical protein
MLSSPRKPSAIQCKSFLQSKNGGALHAEYPELFSQFGYFDGLFYHHRPSLNNNNDELKPSFR